MKKTRISIIALCLLLVCVIAVNFSGCAARAQGADLMEGIRAKAVSGRQADDRFLDSQLRFAVDLFKASVGEREENNVLVSPLSVQLALTMCANGAEGQTKAEMERLLGGNISIEELNEYLYTYVRNLPTDEKYKLEIANSIWFRDDAQRLSMEPDFLQTNADYFGAQIFKSPFDDQTVKDINEWVSKHTDGMIKKIINEIDPYEVIHLINALAFDAEWETPYERSSVRNGIFTNIFGDARNVKMMHSTEYKYIEDDNAVGFIKDYKDEKYGFAALLPNEGIDLYDYIASLTGEALKELLSNIQNETVITAIPEFSYDYSLIMNDVLAEMGMPTAFDDEQADFSKMATSTEGNIFIDRVLHKTYISVDERGTKAAAITDVAMKDFAAAMPENQKEVILDRPFVFMIIDNSTNLPVFIGTVTDIEK